MEATMPVTEKTDVVSYLAHLPVSLFGSVMGLTGLSLAWRHAQADFNMPAAISDGIGIIAMVVFAALVIAYGIKMATSFAVVRGEFNHPIAGNFFGAFNISLLLLPMIVVKYNAMLAQAMWYVGMLAMVGLAWTILHRWMTHKQQVEHASPAWLIPVVGMLDVPIAQTALGLDNLHTVMLFAFSVGIFFAIPLFTLVFSRLVFAEPLPDAMKPSLLVLVAPFSVGFLAYVEVMGQVDTFAGVLYCIMLFMLAVLFTQIRNINKACPFKLSWWAVGFPLSASANAALRYAEYSQNNIAEGIAIVLLAVATIAIIDLLIRTLSGLARGELLKLV
jgi:tellurite resistance protein